VDFFKRLFGGGGGEPRDKDGLYFYIRNNRTGEVIQVRIHKYNDLSRTEDNQGFFVRKLIVGEQSFDRIEAQFCFDKRYNLASHEISGGDLVDYEAYEAHLADQQAEEETTL
jgi:hypothetical protein